MLAPHLGLADPPEDGVDLNRAHRARCDLLRSFSEMLGTSLFCAFDDAGVVPAGDDVERLEDGGGIDAAIAAGGSDASTSARTGKRAVHGVILRHQKPVEGSHDRGPDLDAVRTTEFRDLELLDLDPLRRPRRDRSGRRDRRPDPTPLMRSRIVTISSNGSGGARLSRCMLSRAADRQPLVRADAPSAGCSRSSRRSARAAPTRCRRGWDPADPAGASLSRHWPAASAAARQPARRRRTAACTSGAGTSRAPTRRQSAA